MLRLRLNCTVSGQPRGRSRGDRIDASNGGKFLFDGVAIDAAIGGRARARHAVETEIGWKIDFLAAPPPAGNGYPAQPTRTIASVNARRHDGALNAESRKDMLALRDRSGLCLWLSALRPRNGSRAFHC